MSKVKLAVLQGFTAFLTLLCVYLAMYFVYLPGAVNMICSVLWTFHSVIWFWKTVELQVRLNECVSF